MPQVTVQYRITDQHGARNRAVYAAGQDEVGDNGIRVTLGSNVALWKQNDIVSTVKFLANGIKDRNLLDAQFRGAALATVVNPTIQTVNDRRTASTLVGAGFTQDDIAINVGQLATLAETVQFQTAIDVCLQVLIENLKNQAA